MKIILGFLFALILFLPSSVLAVCPICSVAAAGGVGLSRWLGIDDTISGIWIGGLVTSLAICFLSWLDKKNIKFKFRSFVTLVLFYSITIFPLYQMKLINYSYNNLWGHDKFLIGIILGSLTLSMGAWIHNLLKEKNNNKVYFPFQKVIIPTSFLTCASIIFYFITKC
jgi:hypothetical protein